MSMSWMDRGPVVGRTMMRVRAEDQRILDALAAVLRDAGVTGDIPRTSLWRIAARIAIGEPMVEAARAELGTEAPEGVSAA